MDSPARDVGLGTAYERWAIYRRIERWLGGAPPGTAIEGPLDGMAGMQGLHLVRLAARGTRVTVVLSDAGALARVQEIYDRAGLSSQLDAVHSDTPPRSRRFDVALTFNLACAVDWRRELVGRARVADRLLVFVTHPSSYGVWIRRALRPLEHSPRSPALFDHPAAWPRVLEPALRELGDVEGRAFVDCPWWPDLFVDAGQTLIGASTARLMRRPSSVRRAPASTRYDFGAADFPYLGPLPADLAAALRRHPGFDRWPSPIASRFAHHRAYSIRIRRAPPMDLDGGPV